MTRAAFNVNHQEILGIGCSQEGKVPGAKGEEYTWLKVSFDGERLHSKICLVCGGSAGIGFETSRGLAAAGAIVVLTSPSLARAKRAADSIDGDCRPMRLDFTDFTSVREFARGFLANFQRLDVLIHNAGLVLPQRELNDAGLEKTLCVTYLGPFLLTNLLWPLLEAEIPTRIINVASDLHRLAKLDWDNLQSEKSYHFVSAFARAELAKVLWTNELARRVSSKVATANSLHPGGVRTELFRHFRGPGGWLLKASSYLKSSPRTGAQTTLYLALDEKLAGETGGYYLNRKKKKPAKLALDQELAGQLWERTICLLGQGPEKKTTAT